MAETATGESTQHDSLDGLSEEQHQQLAKQLLDNPLFMGILCVIERQAHHAWQQSNHNEAQAREVLWHRVQVIDKIRLELNGLANQAATSKTELPKAPA